MKTVSEREALRDLSKFLRDMYCWRDQDGRYDTDLVSVTRHTVKSMRRLIDAVLRDDIKVCDKYDSVYSQLCGEAKKRD